ncbi:VanZ family protein [Paenibacillus glycinis]
MRVLKVLTRILLIGLTLIYVLFIVRTLFLDNRLLNDYYLLRYDYNLIPFKTISTYLTGYNNYNFNTWFNNLFGNIILFIPFGFSTPYFSSKLRYFKRFFLFVLFIIVILEVSQMLLHAGSFDVDDVILNSLGAISGYFNYKACLALMKKFDAVSTHTR